ncbi:hypothetical protein FACUT_7652 [Fusarium acutatum]|uniref:Uncharacterized protein n=1 Tax=Fusarium acutatum TaxID=78861 RepID=A0A8H4JLM4_9HYPO|nr:hypothetical protein FACUT_7652 [Fusarium acutatum]
MVKATQPNICDFQRTGDFIEPDPLVSLFESSKRFEYTKQLKATIQSDYAYLFPDFRLDLYHVATILTIPSRNLSHPFGLSIESCLIDGHPYGGNNHHDILEKLERIPPFFRHFVINLQWYSIIFMAFIGTAGSPEMPLRDSLHEKVMTWLGDEPDVSEQEGMGTY